MQAGRERQTKAQKQDDAEVGTQKWAGAVTRECRQMSREGIR
jgi:hypothetical protein